MQFVKYKTKHETTAEKAATKPALEHQSDLNVLVSCPFHPTDWTNSSSAVDAWMQHAISHSGSKSFIATASQINPVNNDPCTELEIFFNGPLLLRSECPDVITWWGISLRLEFYMDSGLSCDTHNGQRLHWYSCIIMSIRTFIFYVREY